MPELFGEIITSDTGDLIPDINRWVIKQASPTTVFAAPATLEAASNNNNSYDATSGGKRLIAQFTGLTVGGYTLLITTGGTHSLATSYNLTASAVNSVGCTMRVRPITAPWSGFTSGPTWDLFNATPPTMGAAITAGVIDTSGTFSTSVQTARIPPVEFIVAAGQTYYGFVIDVKPAAGTAPAGSVNSIESVLSAIESHVYAVRF